MARYLYLKLGSLEDAVGEYAQKEEIKAVFKEYDEELESLQKMYVAQAEEA